MFVISPMHNLLLSYTNVFLKFNLVLSDIKFILLLALGDNLLFIFSIYLSQKNHRKYNKLLFLLVECLFFTVWVILSRYCLSFLQEENVYIFM